MIRGGYYAIKITKQYFVLGMVTQTWNHSTQGVEEEGLKLEAIGDYVLRLCLDK